MWLVMGLWYALSQLPFTWQLALGRQIGHLMQRLGKERARVARINIERCLPLLTPAEHDALLRRNFENLGIAIMEVGFGWWGRDSAFNPLTHIEGLEHIQRLQEQGQGVLLLTNHFYSLEVVARMASRAFPCRIMYRANANPVFEWLSSRRRAHHTREWIPHKSVRRFLDCLAQGETGIYLADQDFRMKNCVFAPFFGIQTATLRKPAEYIRQTGAVLVPAQFWRLPGSKGYQIRLLPPIEGFPSGDDVADATLINQLTEDHIRIAPDQYLWLHRRFKHLPEGEPDFYRKTA
jgi:KDO2-lipid IV(A) lauroyltransferase